MPAAGFPAFAERIAERTERRRHCILLWMTGGPSQMDTFDMKPGHPNGGSYHEIQTAARDCIQRTPSRPGPARQTNRRRPQPEHERKVTTAAARI